MLKPQPGIRRTWKRVLDGDCGIVSTRSLGPKFVTLPSQVAGIVPEGPKSDGRWTASEHVSKTVRRCCELNDDCGIDLYKEARQTAKFGQYALAAAEEALTDAGWKPTKEEELDMTVCPHLSIPNPTDLLNRAFVSAPV